MKIGPLCALAIVALLPTPAVHALTVFVDDDFESYSDTSALEAAWLPVQNAVNYQLINQDYITTINSTTFEDYFLGMRAFNPNDDGSMGKGVEFVGTGALEINLSTLNGGQPLLPSPEQSVVVAGDIFDVGATANKRRTIGLRGVGEVNGSTATENIVEIGFYNSPNGYAHRAILFPGATANPNWDVYPVSDLLDGPDADEITTQFDIGEAWHRYEATITPSSVTFTLDLYRDGLDNATGLPGVDSTVVYEGLETSSLGFSQVRFGGPSGLSSPGLNGYGGALFDNVYVALVEAAAPDLIGDYNGDGFVDAADYTVWRDTLSSTTDLRADGNDNGIIDGPVGAGSDYDLWATNYGAGAPLVAVAVPEPSAVLLVVAGLAALASRRQ